MFSNLKFLAKKPARKTFILISGLSIISIFVILIMRIGAKNPSRVTGINQDNILGINQIKNEQKTLNNPLSPLPTSTTKASPAPSPKQQTQTPKPTPNQVIPTPESRSSNPINNSYTAKKNNFVPTFFLSLENQQPSNSSPVNLDFGSTAGDWQDMGIKIVIPAGFEVAESSKFPQDKQLGEGEATGITNGQSISIKFTILNQSDAKGYKARWLLKFTNQPYPDRSFFLDGDKNGGHTLIFDGPVPMPLSSPAQVKLKIYADVITNPQTSGTFEWKVEYIFADGVSETKKEVEIK